MSVGAPVLFFLLARQALYLTGPSPLPLDFECLSTAFFSTNCSWKVWKMINTVLQTCVYDTRSVSFLLDVTKHLTKEAANKGGAYPDSCGVGCSPWCEEGRGEMGRSSDPWQQGSQSTCSYLSGPESRVWSCLYKPKALPPTIYFLCLDPTSQWFQNLQKQGTSSVPSSQTHKPVEGMLQPNHKRSLRQELPTSLLSFCYKTLSWSFQTETFLTIKCHPYYDQHKYTEILPEVPCEDNRH